MKRSPTELKPGVKISIHDPMSRKQVGEAVVVHRANGLTYLLDPKTTKVSKTAVPDIDARYYLDKGHWKVTGKIRMTQSHKDWAKQEITRVHGAHIFLPKGNRRA